MKKFLVIIKPVDPSYGTEDKPLPGYMIEAKNGHVAMGKAVIKFKKPCEVIWCERKRSKGG